jgi:hypothetical protein
MLDRMVSESPLLGFILTLETICQYTTNTTDILASHYDHHVSEEQILILYMYLQRFQTQLNTYHSSSVMARHCRNSIDEFSCIMSLYKYTLLCGCIHALVSVLINIHTYLLTYPFHS